MQQDNLATLIILQTFDKLYKRDYVWLQSSILGMGVVVWTKTSM